MPTATLSWSRSGYVTYVSGSGTSQYIIKGSSGMGEGIVTFQITTPSGFTWSSSKHMWVGVPNSSPYLYVRDYYTKTNNPVLCLSEYNYLEAYFLSPPFDYGVNEYGWEMISGGTLYAPDPPYDIAIIQAYSSPVSIRYKAHNSCGWSGWVNNSLSASYCGYFYSYSPNPADNELLVEAIPEPNSKEKLNNINISFEVNLFDSNEKLVKTQVSNGNKVILNISDLRKGNYFLHIIDDNRVIKEHIIIE